jgi:hypothetical protein
VAHSDLWKNSDGNAEDATACARNTVAQAPRAATSACDLSWLSSLALRGLQQNS